MIQGSRACGFPYSISMNIVPRFGLGSPAAVEPWRCDRILVDPIRWPLIPSGQRDFIVQHEIAHCEGIVSEIQADAEGFEDFVANGGDPLDAYLAITENLDMTNPAIAHRAELLYQKIPMRELQYFGPDLSADPAQPPVDTSEWDADDWKEVVGTVWSGLPQLLGVFTGRAPSSVPQNVPPPAPKPNYGPYILGGAGLVLFGLIALMIIKR